MVQAMLAEMNQKHGRRVAGVSAAVMERLQQHAWPGNARELRNLMERAVILAQDGGLIELAQLPSGFGRTRLLPAVRCQLRLGARGSDGGRGGAAADSAHPRAHRARTRRAPPRCWA
jgi:DNA-binding NtrC family response regulator